MDSVDTLKGCQSGLKDTATYDFCKYIFERSNDKSYGVGWSKTTPLARALACWYFHGRDPFSATSWDRKQTGRMRCELGLVNVVELYVPQQGC